MQKEKLKRVRGAGRATKRPCDNPVQTESLGEGITVTEDKDTWTCLCAFCEGGEGRAAA